MEQIKLQHHLTLQVNLCFHHGFSPFSFNLLFEQTNFSEQTTTTHLCVCVCELAEKGDQNRTTMK